MAIQWFPPQVAAPSEPIYLYDNPALHLINVSGIKIIQHGRTIRTVLGPIQDFDRIARTPEIGEPNNSQMANLFTQTNIPWQRRLDAERLPIIEGWWKNNFSSSPNGSLIFFNDIQNLIDIPETNHFTVSLDPSAWTFQVCPNCGWTPEEIDSSFQGWYADCCQSCGNCTRPGLVVDGQHRLRGMSRNPDLNNNHLEPVFSTWLLQQDGFNRNRVARIFTEVTSSAVALPKLHQEFLSAKYDLQPHYDPLLLSGLNRKRAYFIASQLNLTAGPWGNTDGRIEMIDRKRSNNGDIIDVARLTDYIARWIDHGPFDNMTDQDILDAMENFLQAVLIVWRGDQFWNNGRHMVGSLQSRGVFRMLLTILEKTSSRLRQSGLDLSARNYIDELNYIRPINWSLSEWYQVYTRQDADQNITRRILQAIYDSAPMPPIAPGTTISTNVNQWMSFSPDEITVMNCSASIEADLLEVEFEVQFPIVTVATVTLNWPQNAKGTATAIIERGGDVIGEFPFNGSLRKELSSIDRTITEGDILEITILHRSWNITPTIANFDVQVLE